MNFHIGTVVNFDQETFSIEVALDDLGGTTIFPTIVNGSPTDPKGGGSWSAPSEGSRCVVISEDQVYYLIGYYNLPGATGSSGMLKNEEFPKTAIGYGDTLMKHPRGSFLLLSDGALSATMGIGARMNLVGGVDNRLSLDLMRLRVSNTAGDFNWKIIGNESGNSASEWKWRINKNYEADIPSDYVETRIGSISAGNGEWKTSIYELDVIQQETSEVYLTVGKDDSDNHYRLLIKDLIGDRGAELKLLTENEYYNVAFDDKYSYIIDNDGNVKTNIIDSGSWYLTSKDIKIGSTNSSEPLVLGDVMKTLLEELGDIIIESKHLHPQGPTTGLFTPDRIKVNKWKAKLPNALSDIAATEK